MGKGSFKFDGGAGTYIGTGILAFLVTALTLGIALPFAIVLRQRWRAKHTIIDGRAPSVRRNRHESVPPLVEVVALGRNHDRHLLVLGSATHPEMDRREHGLGSASRRRVTRWLLAPSRQEIVHARPVGGRHPFGGALLVWQAERSEALAS